MNSTSEIRQAFTAFRTQDHTTPDETLNWCREACLALAEVDDPVRLMSSLRHLIGEWDAQYGRFQEALGEENPRLQFVDGRITAIREIIAKNPAPSR